MNKSWLDVVVGHKVVAVAVGHKAVAVAAAVVAVVAASVAVASVEIGIDEVSVHMVVVVGIDEVVVDIDYIRVVVVVADMVGVNFHNMEEEEDFHLKLMVLNKEFDYYFLELNFHPFFAR